MHNCIQAYGVTFTDLFIPQAAVLRVRAVPSSQHSYQPPLQPMPRFRNPDGMGVLGRGISNNPVSLDPGSPSSRRLVWKPAGQQEPHLTSTTPPPPPPPRLITPAGF